MIRSGLSVHTEKCVLPVDLEQLLTAAARRQQDYPVESGQSTQSPDPPGEIW